MGFLTNRHKTEAVDKIAKLGIPDQTSDNLGDLWKEAESYGCVDAFSLSGGRYSAQITFKTIENIKLEAKSGYNCLTVGSALKEAIKKASVIVSSMK